jgi:hypothetical protein
MSLFEHSVKSTVYLSLYIYMYVYTCIFLLGKLLRHIDIATKPNNHILLPYLITFLELIVI